MHTLCTYLVYKVNCLKEWGHTITYVLCSRCYYVVSPDTLFRGQKYKSQVSQNTSWFMRDKMFSVSKGTVLALKRRGERGNCCFPIEICHQPCPLTEYTLSKTKNAAELAPDLQNTWKCLNGAFYLISIAFMHVHYLKNLLWVIFVSLWEAQLKQTNQLLGKISKVHKQSLLYF